MGPQNQGTIVDLQLQPAFEFVALALPESPDLADALAERMTHLSAEGYAIVAQTPFYLLLGKQVAVHKLSVDVGRVILPFTAPQAAIRQ